MIMLSSCAHNLPGGVCTEYGGVRRISPRYVFCNVRTLVYDRQQRIYLNRESDDITLD